MRWCLAFVLVWFAVSTRVPFLEGADSRENKHRSANEIDFGRDIRPILSNNCFSCHGPDERTREAELRLDTADGLRGFTPKTQTSTSRQIVVPGRTSESLLWKRITSDDPTIRMPPQESGKSLSQKQTELLRLWIEQGAAVNAFWSFEPIRRHSVANSPTASWAQTSIDTLVLSELHRQQLAPSGEASKDVLLRRLALDLVGLPPKVWEHDEFLADDRPDAYDRHIDRLLASPHYGERMALDWLDAARYADTFGYFSDLERAMWPWRDWVISAFNANLGYDRFTLEQLAGDLLPSASESQLIATGFHRNQPATNESGIIEEEYRVEYVADRVDTTATIWLGLTMGCARCHDHKYDPLTQRDYYQLFAFFNQGPETGLVRGTMAPPTLTVPTDDQKSHTELLRKRREDCEKTYAAQEAALHESLSHLESQFVSPSSKSIDDSLIAHLPLDGDTSDIVPSRPVPEPHGDLKYVDGVSGKALNLYGAEHVELSPQLTLSETAPWSISLWFRTDSRYSIGCLLSKVKPDGNRRGIEILTKKRSLVVNLIHSWGKNALEVTLRDSFQAGKWHHLVVSYDGSSRASSLNIFVDGIRRDFRVDNDSLSGSIANDEPWRIGRRDVSLAFFGQLDDVRLFSRQVKQDEVLGYFQDLMFRPIIAKPYAKRSEEERELVLAAFLPSLGESAARTAWQELKQARAQEKTHLESIPTVMVAKEIDKPRDTFILSRGRYDAPGEKVGADVPGALPPMSQDLPRNRLGLAKWLTDPRNPLTPRVTANRLWRLLFGEGIVRSVNDFGSQGEPATHPELLDYLSAELIDSQWNVKRQIRMMVLSATYRQSSARSVAWQQLDPENRLLARGPRFRLTGESIRDQALAASGLWEPSIGGPSVKPYQPAGLWEAVSYDADQTYVVDRGGSLFRRSLYTYWKRQIPPPSLSTFDSPTRETCVVQRSRTNTPLQALVTMNDTTFVEAARCLAAKAMSNGAGSASIAESAFVSLLARRPNHQELNELLELYQLRLREFQENRDAAIELGQAGESGASRDIDPVQLAAWTVVTSAIMNLDEAVTKR